MATFSQGPKTPGADVLPLFGPQNIRVRDLLAALRSQHAQQSTEMALMARVVRLQSELGDCRRRLHRLNGLARQQQRQALTDSLTDLPNRRAWQLRLAEATTYRLRHGGELQLALLDVDHFKHINDALGHPAGDKALRLISRLLSTRLRGSDFLARYGGEEFAILLPSTSRADARVVVEQLRAAIEAAPFHSRGRRIQVTCSAGLAFFAGDESAADVLSRADQALYRAKQGGRNRLELG